MAMYDNATNLSFDPNTSFQNVTRKIVLLAETKPKYSTVHSRIFMEGMDQEGGPLMALVPFLSTVLMHSVHQII